MTRRVDLLLVTEISLAIMTAATVAGMHRLFLDNSFLAPLLLQVVLAHVTIAAVRRAGIRLSMSTFLSVVAAAVAIVWTQYMRTLWIVLPSPDTWTTIRADIDHALLVLNDVSAPAPVEAGFILASSMAIWLIVFVADWGAFRTSASFESLLPSATLFLVTALLGHETPMGLSAPLYATTALVFLLLHRSWRQESSAGWASLQRQRSRRYLLATGGLLATTAVLAGSLVGPRLPGADDPPILDWRGVGDGEDTRVVISPLVDVRGRLVRQSDLEVFTVRTDDQQGAYWRLTALDSFDGTIWRSSYQTDPAQGELPRSVDSSSDTRRMTQEITISALGQIWLPAAYEPIALDTTDPVVYDDRSSTLIVDRSAGSSDNLSYTVVSEVPDPASSELQNASDNVPESIANRYLDLPDNFNSLVTDEALRITAETGAQSHYEKALALQTYLRTFEYTLEVDEGHGEDALVEFLYNTQRGYCEQFAGAFAAMARSLGIPSRVVVGFTKGVEDPNEPGLFRVQGKHAHAWAEVYLDGYGWVTFDPTPNRAPPNAEGWLGVPEEQAAADGVDGTSSTTLPGRQDAAPPDPTPGDGAGAGEDATEAGPNPAVPGGDIPSGPSPEADSRSVIPEILTTVLTRTAPFVLAYLLLVPTGLAVQQHLRRRRARLPAQQIDLAWDETLERSSRLGIDLAPSMTVNERARRLEAALPAAAPTVDHMARIVERARYAETGVAPADATQIRSAARTVQSELDRQHAWYRRVLTNLDARRLLPRHRTVRRAAHGAARSGD